MFNFKKQPTTPPLYFFNTLTREKELFAEPKNKTVGLYTCGPTVYNYAHIGNLRTYVFEDLLKRVLQYNNYEVNHVMNITDVGHLTSDADVGEDKMEKGAKREGKSAWDIAKFYTTKFKENLKDLNIEEPNIWCPATDHIPEQIALVQKLIDKGVTYTTTDGIYFDTTKIDDYGKLANLKNQKLQAGIRVDMGEKKNPQDFALWKFSPAGEKRQMEWEAFGRMGFPGWHIECSAMSMKYLGEQFAIHCGGIDHVSVHHTNEIAQSETATGIKPWVKFWMHGEFLNIADTKMAKAGENFITLDTLKEKNIDPLAYRFFLLQTHYRKVINFSWDALQGAQNGLNNLYKEALKLKKEASTEDKNVLEAFLKNINDDLAVSEALAFVWKSIEENKISFQTLLQFDKIFGLQITTNVERLEKETNFSIPNDAQKLLDLRQQARDNKNWAESDKLREEIKNLGFDVEDTSQGQKLNKL